MVVMTKLIVQTRIGNKRSWQTLLIINTYYHYYYYRGTLVFGYLPASSTLTYATGHSYRSNFISRKYSGVGSPPPRCCAISQKLRGNNWRRSACVCVKTLWPFCGRFVGAKMNDTRILTFQISSFLGINLLETEKKGLYLERHTGFDIFFLVDFRILVGWDNYRGGEMLRPLLWA